ncbi:MAG: hypothetical protein EPN88_02060 [Bacteroidetes bacterium]|nr:MAG: hypothetical protein EPN88_02060 [Bacteroidota bacterium]
MNTFYHFTAKHLLPDILQQGLTLGKFPLISETSISFIKPCQWLTVNDKFETQSWNTSNLIKYSRNDYRLTIEIPKANKIIKATDYIKLIPLEYRHIVMDWVGSDEWYLYLGKISPEWIKSYQERI